MSPATKVGKVFISYRRADTLGDARQLKQLLGERFGASQVFLDEGSIETGDEWALKIKSSLDEATAVIVLMGPSWLSHLKGRYAEGDKTDWVRLELARAIERRKAKDLQLLMPLLLSEISPPSAEGLEPELETLISQLSEYQCGPYAIGESSDLSHLEMDLVLKGGLRDARHGQQCLDACGARLDELLANEELTPLRQAWSTPPLKPQLEANLISCFADLRQAFKRAKDWPALEQDQHLERSEMLRQVVGLLFQMCADHGKTYLWAGHLNTLAWPTRNAGTAAGLKATTMGMTIIPNVSKQDMDPGFELVYPSGVAEAGLSALDPVAKEQLRGEVTHQVIKNHPHASRDPNLIAPTLTETKLRYARSIIKRDRARGVAHFLAERVAAGCAASSHAVAVAEELGMVLIPYSGIEHDWFRQVENEEIYLEVMSCLKAIPNHLLADAP